MISTGRPKTSEMAIDTKPVRAARTSRFHRGQLGEGAGQEKGGIEGADGGRGEGRPRSVHDWHAQTPQHEGGSEHGKAGGSAGGDAEAGVKKPLEAAMREEKPADKQHCGAAPDRQVYADEPLDAEGCGLLRAWWAVGGFVGALRLFARMRYRLFRRGFRGRRRFGHRSAPRGRSGDDRGDDRLGLDALYGRLLTFEVVQARLQGLDLFLHANDHAKSDDRQDQCQSYHAASPWKTARLFPLPSTCKPTEALSIMLLHGENFVSYPGLGRSPV